MGSTRGAWSLVVCVAWVAGVTACGSPKTSTSDAGVTSPEWDFGDDPLVIRLNVVDGAGFACAAGFTGDEVAADLAEAITRAPHHCRGSQGSFACSCDGARRESYAFTCPAALFEACEVAAERVDGSGDEPPEVEECRARSRELDGRCTLNEAGGYDCSCDGEQVAAVASDELTHASCDQALFQTCAPGCSDDFGACTPSPRGTLGEHDCTCETNAFTQVARAASCRDALLWACNPLNQAEEVCTGYGGACVAIDRDAPERLTCTCVDGTRHEVEREASADEPRFRACREALEATCGTGTPPQGAQCIAEANGYHARCTRGPGEGAALTCECYADGEADARVAPVEERDCDRATLEAFCPELAD